MLRRRIREYSMPTQGVEALEEVFEDCSLEREEGDFTEIVEAKE